MEVDYHTRRSLVTDTVKVMNDDGKTVVVDDIEEAVMDLI
jgi:hypothetical protein